MTTTPLGGTAGGGRPRKGLAIASIVVGILGVLATWILVGFLPHLGLRAARTAVQLVPVAALVLFFLGAGLGEMARDRARRRPLEYGGKYLAMLGWVVSVLAGSQAFAACYILNIHPPGTYREMFVRGDVRDVISAQKSYRSVNGGFYDTLECVSAPADCIPDYPATAPPSFMSEFMASLAPHGGYDRGFYPGPPADPEEIRRAGASPSSITSFAYVAVPTVWDETGVDGYCGDSSGRIYSTPDGTAPVVDGVCAPRRMENAR